MECVGLLLFFFQAEDGIRDDLVTGVQTCALPICYVNKVYADEGAVVEKGEILAEIDDTDVRVEISFKEMKVRKAEADLSRAEGLKKANALSNLDYENALAAFKAAEIDLEASNLKQKYTKVVAGT